MSALPSEPALPRSLPSEEPHRGSLSGRLNSLRAGVLGATGARLGRSSLLKPTLRVVIGALAALVVTFAIGSLLGTSGPV